MPRSTVLAGAGALVAAVAVFVLRPFVVAVTGPSMEPTLSDGDRLFALGGCGRHLARAGDIVVLDLDREAIRSWLCHDPGLEEELLVKRLAVRGPGVASFDYSDDLRTAIRVHGWVVDRSRQVSCEVPLGFVFVMSDNANGGIDSRFFGPVPSRCIAGWLGRRPVAVPAPDHLVEQEVDP